jgi:tRNA (uracil-5-)-methyltransferase
VDRTTESDWCGEAAPVAAELGISITAVAKGVLWTVGPREIEERLELADGAVLRYRQVPGSFSNPNGGVNVRVLQWLRQQCLAVLSQRGGGGAGSGTLLEMYNGCGNHTVALASLFGKVIAVEGDRALVDIARRNYALNGETPPSVFVQASRHLHLATAVEP